MDNFTKGMLKFLAVYTVCMGTLIFLLKTVFIVSYIPSGSMGDTIMVGDVVFGTRYDTGEEDIERYDILIFSPPDKPDQAYIKRVIGLPGETIEIRDGKVYADGVELEDSFIKGPMNGKTDGIYQVPEGKYFFLGDNRNNSKDSRYWREKYVPLKNIQAKVLYRIFPFDSVCALK